MLSYAGLDLMHATEAIDAWAVGNIDPSWSARALSRAGQDSGLDFLSRGDIIAPGPQEIGVLVWPCWGACRWAEGLFLCDDATLLELRQKCFKGGTVVAQTFVMDDGLKSVETELFMLPARPVTQPDPRAGSLWLLTLVDRRYFWWFTSASLRVYAGVTAWADVYLQLAGGLNVEIAVDDIDPAYLKPPTQLSDLRRPAPLCLDAAAGAVGQRLVFNLDGTIRAMSADSSLDLHARNLRRFADRLAGGTLSLARPDGADAPAELPASVTMSFRRDAADPVPYDIETTLASLLASGTEPRLTALFEGVVGFSGTKILRSMAASGGDPVPDNQAELQALALRASADYYKHRAGRADVRLEGAQPWACEGLTWTLEYEHRLGRLSTRATRGPSIEHAEELTHRSDAHPGNVTYYNEGDIFWYDGSKITYVNSTNVTLRTTQLYFEDNTFFCLENYSTVYLEFSPAFYFFDFSQLYFDGGDIYFICGGLYLENNIAICFEDYTFWVTGVTQNIFIFGGAVNWGGTGYIVYDVGNEFCWWWALCGESYSLTTGTNNWAASGKSVLRTTTDQLRELSGIKPQLNDGTPAAAIRVLVNTGEPLKITHDDPSSDAANRFYTPGESPAYLGKHDSAAIRYDPDSSRWRLMSATNPVDRPYSPTIGAGPHDDYEVPVGSTSLSPVLSAAAVITGLAGLPVGNRLLVINLYGSSYTLTLNHQDAGSAAANRFYSTTATDTVLYPGEGVWVLNDGARVLVLCCPDGAAPPAFSGARVYKTATQSVASGTWTTADFNASRYDTDSYQSGSKLYAPSTGYYDLGGGAQFANLNTAYNFGLRIVLNGTYVLAQTVGPQALTTGGLIEVTDLNVNTHHALAAGDYVELQVYQKSGSTGDYLLATPRSSAEFWIAKMAGGGPRGAPGLPGAAGSTWRNGTGAPSSGLGSNGDYYIDTATGDVYYKSSGTYSVVFNIGATIAVGDLIGGGTAGSVLFAGASALLAQDNANLFYDDANNVLRAFLVTASKASAPNITQLPNGQTTFFSIPATP